jgi:uncharacterized protein (TIGR02588 family)
MRNNWLEWLVLAFSVTVLVGVVGFLVIDGIVDEGRPPDPVVTLHHAQAHVGGQGWYLPATVTNRGDSAAEAVLLRASAVVGGDEEESEVTIDYLPSGTDVEVTFAFSAEPDGEVTARPIGFRLP